MGKLKLSDLLILGDLYHNLELYDQSLKAYQEAIRNQQKLPLENYIRVARILINRGSYEDGFSHLEEIEKNFEWVTLSMMKSNFYKPVLRATGKIPKLRLS